MATSHPLPWEYHSQLLLFTPSSFLSFFTDVQMPGLSGVELQNRLLSDGYHMPTIFISAFPNSQIEEWVVQRGAIAYLRKPFNEDELFEHLQTAVKRGRG